MCMKRNGLLLMGRAKEAVPIRFGSGNAGLPFLSGSGRRLDGCSAPHDPCV